MSFLAGAYRYTPRIRNKSSSGKASWERIAAFCLIFFAVFFATLTYAVMAELIPVESNSGVIIWLLNLDIVILLLLVSLTANRIIALWSNRRKGVAGSKLQTRLVIIFCVLAAVPAIIMTVFSAYFFHYGVQTWFSVGEARLVDGWLSTEVEPYNTSVCTTIRCRLSHEVKFAEPYSCQIPSYSFF